MSRGLKVKVALFGILQWNSVQGDIVYEYCNHTIGYQVVYPKVQLLLLDFLTNNGVYVG